MTSEELATKHVVLGARHCVRGVWGPILALHFVLGAAYFEIGAESEIWDRGMWNRDDQNAYFSRKNFFRKFLAKNIFCVL